MQKLVEATRKNLFSYSNDEGDLKTVALFGSKKGGWPFAVVSQKGDKFIVSTGSARAKTKYMDLARYARRFGIDGIDKEDANWVVPVNQWTQGKSAVMLDKRLPEFKFQEFDTQAFTEFALTKLRLPSTSIKGIFGIEADRYTAQVAIPGTPAVSVANHTVVEKNVKRVHQMVKQAYDILTKAGMGHLLDGRQFVIDKMPNSPTAAAYVTKSPIPGKEKSIIINTATSGFRSTKNVVHDILHESAHAWEFETNIGKAIASKFKEVSETESQPTVDLDQSDVLMYDGPKRSLKGIPWAFIRVQKTKGSWMILMMNLNEFRETEDVKRAGFIQYPIDNVVKDEFLTKWGGEPISVTRGTDWFHTDYALTNPHEFFAELFPLWVTGKATPEVSAWFESLAM